ncbi:hypothetical protein ACWEOH_02395 [Agromyces sp. NPDC004153]
MRNEDSILIDRTWIDLPPGAPAKTAAALKAAHALQERTAAIWAERARLDHAVAQAEVDEVARRARALAAGEELADTSPVAELRAQREVAVANVAAIDQAQPVVIAALRQAVADDREVWSLSAAAKAEAGLKTAVTALRMAEQASVELNAGLGVLHMYAEHDAGGSQLAVAVGRDSYTFDLSVALQSLREAVGKARDELDRLKPVKRRKGKKGAADEPEVEAEGDEAEPPTAARKPPPIFDQADDNWMED